MGVGVGSTETGEDVSEHPITQATPKKAIGKKTRVNLRIIGLP